MWAPDCVPQHNINLSSSSYRVALSFKLQPPRCEGTITTYRNWKEPSTLLPYRSLPGSCRRQSLLGAWPQWDVDRVPSSFQCKRREDVADASFSDVLTSTPTPILTPTPNCNPTPTHTPTLIQIVPLPLLLKGTLALTLALSGWSLVHMGCMHNHNPYCIGWSLVQPRSP